MFTLQNFYKSKEWERLRAQLQLDRINEDGELLCDLCGKPILRKYDCIAHHKIELTDENVNDFTVSLNPENVQLIHFRCHNLIHDRFEGFRQKVYIVHGAPCSGKSSFVRENARKDDLILDMDAIYHAISLGDLHEKSARLKPVAFAIRDSIMDQIRIRSGKWRTAWIISTKTGLELERDADLLNATLIHIDTDMASCMANLEKNPDGRKPEEWRGHIKDYFDRLERFG